MILYKKCGCLCVPIWSED